MPAPAKNRAGQGGKVGGVSLKPWFDLQNIVGKTGMPGGPGRFVILNLNNAWAMLGLNYYLLVLS